jgi:hypothetical protein
MLSVVYGAINADNRDSLEGKSSVGQVERERQVRQKVGDIPPFTSRNESDNLRRASQRPLLVPSRQLYNPTRRASSAFSFLAPLFAALYFFPSPTRPPLNPLAFPYTLPDF